MEPARRPRLKVWTPLIAAAIMVIGMVIGFRLHDTLRSKRDIESVVERSDRLEQMIDLIREKYVDSVNSNDLYSDAVKGILSHLDPHTVYIPAHELADVNEDLAGTFFGIGVEFTIVRDSIEVTYVVENGPSDKAGVQVGDKLVRVNDTLVAGNGITSDRIIEMLRGQQKSAVKVVVQRLDESGLRNLEIRRDEVPIVSVDVALMLDSSTGYIKINRFAANTYSEFADALKRLKKQGIKNLLLDLRGNPGGYLDAATQIADEFLDDDKVIVFTRGMHEDVQTYKAVNSGLFEEGRLAILIDENSASASEIVAGAIQDWDRGIIVGRRSFGKGLVQEQYDLEDGSALRLTIARYYAPSGRSIQRPFDKGRQAYQDDFEQRFISGELIGQDSVVLEDTQSYYTMIRKRMVHGGGGIKPDIYVPYDSGRLTADLLDLLLSDALQNAIWDYYGFSHNDLKRFKTASEFNRDFKESELILKRFIAGLSPAQQYGARLVLSRPANREYLILEIKSQVARILFRNVGYYYVNTRGDELIQKALQVVRGPKYQQLIGR